MSQHWGHTDVRLFEASNHDEAHTHTGTYAEVRRGCQVELLRSLGDAAWFRVEGSADDLKAQDFTLVTEQDPNHFDESDPSTIHSLRHFLEQVELARCIATRAHAGQTDKVGRPYIAHPHRGPTGCPTCRPRRWRGSTTCSRTPTSWRKTSAPPAATGT